MDDLTVRLRLAGNPDCWKAADEIERLRAIIEAAPHDALCTWSIHHGAGKHCDCWKAALRGEVSDAPPDPDEYRDRDGLVW